MIEAVILNLETKRETVERFTCSARAAITSIRKAGWHKPGFAVWLFEDDKRKPMAYKPSYCSVFNFKVFR